jgi:hypothetical protein
MATITLANLRTAVRRRADMVNSLFVSDAELTEYVNGSCAELHDLLVGRFEEYYTKSASATIAAGASTFALPSDFLKLRGLDYLVDGASDYATIHPFNFAERNKYGTGDLRRSDAPDIAYRLLESTVQIMPTDDAPGTYRVWYVRAWTDLSSDSDTLTTLNNWHEYVIVDAAIKCLQKEESDVSTLMMQKAALTMRIKNASIHRDAAEPETVADVISGDGVGTWDA